MADVDTKLIYIYIYTYKNKLKKTYGGDKMLQNVLLNEYHYLSLILS